MVAQTCANFLNYMCYRMLPSVEQVRMISTEEPVLLSLSRKSILPTNNTVCGAMVRKEIDREEPSIFTHTTTRVQKQEFLRMVQC